MSIWRQFACGILAHIDASAQTILCHLLNSNRDFLHNDTQSMFARSMCELLFSPQRAGCRALRVCLLAICLPLVAVCQSYGQGSSPLAYRSGPGIVLLSNGEVLSGNVQPFDAELEIRIDDTAVVRTGYDKVRYIGQTMDELYLWQLNQVKDWTYNDHLKLARWCTQHKQFDRAMPHYEVLKRDMSAQPEFKRLQTELREAMLRDQEVQTALNAAGIHTNASNVQQASATSATTKTPSSPVGLNHRPQETIRIDATYQEIFRKDIHPILVSSCARAACHGTFSNTKLIFIEANRMSSKDALGRNLSTFSEYLNRTKGTPDAPPESHPMYQKAVGMHGSMMQSALDVNDPKHQKFMEQLRLWIARTNSNQSQSSSQVANDSTKPTSTLTMAPIQAPPDLWAKARTHDNQSLESQAKAAAAKEAQLLAGQSFDGLAAAIAKLEAIEKEKTDKKDPFDPAEFNAQVAKSKNGELDSTVKK